MLGVSEVYLATLRPGICTDTFATRLDARYPHSSVTQAEAISKVSLEAEKMLSRCAGPPIICRMLILQLL